MPSFINTHAKFPPVPPHLPQISHSPSNEYASQELASFPHQYSPWEGRTDRSKVDHFVYQAIDPQFPRLFGRPEAQFWGYQLLHWLYFAVPEQPEDIIEANQFCPMEFGGFNVGHPPVAYNEVVAATPLDAFAALCKVLASKVWRSFRASQCRLETLKRRG
ncbi:hypothetical protein K504DRAFT_499748 [Pleomassaria siparia CBS 279.74]|uniref:Uncharacterized protein n=1 Tax=Pleomassaria siparia CBS 279.74 TaxID=1314801 RepID=A0A6G1KIJ9_9PLEO|nr:hypothetical protein K504DRAFT_499748 [Pleomassaria siparia CBS 279.74]